MTRALQTRATQGFKKGPADLCRQNSVDSAKVASSRASQFHLAAHSIDSWESVWVRRQVGITAFKERGSSRDLRCRIAVICEGLALAGPRTYPNLAPSCCDTRRLYCLELSIVSVISMHPIQICSTSTLCCAVLGGRWIESRHLRSKSYVRLIFASPLLYDH